MRKGWFGVVATLSLVAATIAASVYVKYSKTAFAADVDVRREATEWVREAGYSTLGVTCLAQDGLYTQCSVSVVGRDNDIELSCNNLTGTCERVD